MNARRLLKPAALVVLAVLGLGLALATVDALDDRAASGVTRLGTLGVDMRLTPLALRRLGAVSEDFAVGPSGAVFLNLDGGFAQLPASGAGIRRAPAPSAPITSLALDTAGHMLTVSGGYLGVVTSDPGALNSLVLPYDNARLAPSARPGTVYMFGGTEGHQRLYRFTEAGRFDALLDSPEPIVAAADDERSVYAATARQVVRLGDRVPEVVFRAPDDPDWGPIVSVAVGADGLLFVATPKRVYAVLHRRALSIVNDSGGALRIAGQTLYVLDHGRGLLYALSPASADMFGKGA